MDTNLLTPQRLLLRMAEILHMQIEEKEDGRCSFQIEKTAASPDFFKAADFLFKINHTDIIDCPSSVATVCYIPERKENKNRNGCLSIQTVHYEAIHRRLDDTSFAEGAPYKQNKLGIRYHIYDQGKAWNYTGNKKWFPCSMKDFFYYQKRENVESDIFHALFLAWGDAIPIWKDLASDFHDGCAYSSIPLDLIISCGSKRELIEKRYALGLKRNNKETIGNGIFLARAKRLVSDGEWQKLFGWNCIPCFIGREKKDMAYPLSTFLYEKMKMKYGDMVLSASYYEGQERKERKVTIKRSFVEDAIIMSIQLKRPIPLTFHSLKAIKKWHDNLAVLQRSKGLPVMDIPKNSRFKNLRLPADCIRLTTRKQMVEESVAQHNCVSGYIYSVNEDTCSIWSMHKEDGSRNTIEICIRTSKKNPDGYFYIEQMKGFDNTEVLQEDWDAVKDAIENSLVFRDI